MARVLLAESDRRICEFVAGILSDCGHFVVVCADGVEAAVSLATRAIDVVVTDLVLGRAGGSLLGQNCLELGVPMITLSGDEFRPGQAAAAGRPPSFLEKPFRFGDLQCVLDAVAVRCASTKEIDRETRSAA